MAPPDLAAHAPVDMPNTGSDHDGATPPEPGMALCLSGGGYRAMLFHTGSIWRLYEAKLLQALKRVSSVSGGSITAAVLGLKWDKVVAPGAGIAEFRREVVQPIRQLADETIDADAIITGMLWFGTIGEKVAGAYRKHLFGHRTLQDFSDKGPRFVLNATNVQSGTLWRFSKPYMADYRVGKVEQPTVELADAVAASSAFPPVLSPFSLKLDPATVIRMEGADLHRKPFTHRAVLSDGGVYDNLGLETAWKRYDTILVSDGGGQTQPEEDPKSDWARHAYRVLNLIDNQVRSLRRRQLIGSYTAPPGQLNHRKGTFWGIRTDIANYQLKDALPCPLAWSSALADLPTRLKRVPDDQQKALINWGYAVCDAAIRRHVDAGIPKGAFPFPEATP